MQCSIACFFAAALVLLAGLSVAGMWQSTMGDTLGIRQFSFLDGIQQFTSVAASFTLGAGAFTLGGAASFSCELKILSNFLIALKLTSPFYLCSFELHL